MPAPSRRTTQAASSSSWSPTGRSATSACCSTGGSRPCGRSPGPRGFMYDSTNDEWLIRQTGFKWMGYLPKQRLLYNLGWYTDTLSEGQSFSSYDQQVVARVGFLPILVEKGTLLHVALAGRYGLVNDRALRLRSRPELNLAPYFVETESFAARDTRMAQAEVYYRPGPGCSVWSTSSRRSTPASCPTALPRG